MLLWAKPIPHIYVIPCEQVVAGASRRDNLSGHVDPLISLKCSNLYQLDTGPGLSLRVPLSVFQSTTYAFYPDETHSAIRRVFTPRNAPNTKRHFCGFCGTQLTYWSEENPEEADWVFVSLGSLKNESLERLDDAGILDATEEDDKEHAGNDIEARKELIKKKHDQELLGTPWFEETNQRVELGKMKRRRGGQSSSDGRIRVEWEIVEITGGDEVDTIVGTGKRKANILEDDAEMK